jgi:hypothetical protein
LKQYTSFREEKSEKEIKIKCSKVAKLLVENEKERVTLVKEKQVQEQLVNSIKKDKKNCI